MTKLNLGKWEVEDDQTNGVLNFFSVNSGVNHLQVHENGPVAVTNAGLEVGDLGWNINSAGSEMTFGRGQSVYSGDGYLDFRDDAGNSRFRLDGNNKEVEIRVGTDLKVTEGEADFGGEGSSRQNRVIKTGWYSGTSSSSGWIRMVRFPHNGGNNKNIMAHLRAHNRKDSTGGVYFKIDTWIEAGAYDNDWGASGDILDSGTYWRVVVGSDTTEAYLELDMGAGWDTGHLALDMDTHGVRPQCINDGSQF